MKGLNALLEEPRKGFPGLSKPEFEGRTPDQQRLIIVLEQVAYRLNASSQRSLASRLNISQPSLRGWMVGDIAEPNGIKRSDLEKIAAARGLTLLELRAFLDGTDPSVLPSTAPKPEPGLEDYLKLIEVLPVFSLYRLLFNIANRLMKEFKEEVIKEPGTRA
ncbi:hypothetical protein K9N68_37655 (plasmid) [Kovacikia minuta CCNUW1]|uniref:hypothetical protein n=1 Tax=Kovacikia minuta TaxID=2931930 RepID=UPI001CCA935D|nr:hypothetical protein [Kovacikia minuta]UBF29940.1 hypothetical protein K9N68_37655 [Kovacikia minuta CCNUW1]